MGSLVLTFRPGVAVTFWGPRINRRTLTRADLPGPGESVAVRDDEGRRVGTIRRVRAAEAGRGTPVVRFELPDAVRIDRVRVAGPRPAPPPPAPPAAKKRGPSGLHLTIRPGETLVLCGPNLARRVLHGDDLPEDGRTVDVCDDDGECLGMIVGMPRRSDDPHRRPLVVALPRSVRVVRSDAPDGLWERMRTP